MPRKARAQASVGQRPGLRIAVGHPVGEQGSVEGEKSLAERIVYGALEQARDKTGTDPVITLKRALDNVKPALEVRSRRVGGATYQVPVEVRPDRSTTLALRWLVGYSRQRREKTMIERLANEILMPAMALGPPSSGVRTPTRWPRRTEPLRIIAGEKRRLASQGANRQ